MKKLFFTLLTLCVPLIYNAQAQNSLNGYEWLKGEWIGLGEDGFWGAVSIGENGYSIVNYNWNTPSDPLSEAKLTLVSVKPMMNRIIGRKVIGIGEYLYLDVQKHELYMILGEFEEICLHKVDNSKSGWVQGRWQYEDEVFMFAGNKIASFKKNTDSWSFVNSCTYTIEDEFINTECLDDALMAIMSIRRVAYEGGDYLNRIK